MVLTLWVLGSVFRTYGFGANPEPETPGPYTPRGEPHRTGGCTCLALVVVSAETPFHVQPDYPIRISFGMAERERQNPKLVSFKILSP